ncbi:hypothetical protein F5Y18DRAFT_362875 [Xylariaceae sp. FL1019]|nr:hypothetical protein F5Y18DRAFT_362875 [Xylariaceae sp. FL1019]
MAIRLPHTLSRRPTACLPVSYSPLSHTPLSHTPSRAATLIKRPRRPYTFTQLVQLSDGSTYTMRTSSPLGLYKSTKDPRNHILWQPTDKSLRNVEVDEAGKLAAFRSRFGSGWDAPEAVDVENVTVEEVDTKRKGKKGELIKEKDVQVKDVPKQVQKEEGYGDALADLISGYAVGVPELPDSKPKPKKK